MLINNLAIGASFFLVVLFLFAGLLIFRKICVRKHERPNTFEDLFSEHRILLAGEQRLREDYEWFDNNRTREVCTVSYDGLRLFATVIEAPKDQVPKGVVMLFHGYRSNARRDFCMQMKILHDNGYHLLVVDQRAHSRSGGKYICYGIKERYDVVSWRKKVAELFGKEMPVAIMGLSMGGATVLMSSELFEEEDEAVRCIIADCPFSSAQEAISHVIKEYNKVPLASLLLKAAGFWSRTLAGFTLSAPSASEIFSRSHLPALIFHGEDDDYVPIQQSKDVQSLSKDRTTLVCIPGAKHADSIYCDEERYVTALLSFLDDHME